MILDETANIRDFVIYLRGVGDRAARRKVKLLAIEFECNLVRCQIHDVGCLDVIERHHLSNLLWFVVGFDVQLLLHTIEFLILRDLVNPEQ